MRRAGHGGAQLDLQAAQHIFGASEFALFGGKAASQRRGFISEAIDLTAQPALGFAPRTEAQPLMEEPSDEPAENQCGRQACPKLS